MEKYSCFRCPSKDYSLKNLDDICPKCGYKYNFPLLYFPQEIAGVKIVNYLARGFYGATYIGEIIPFGKKKVKKVIKIIPVDLYKYHNKSFNDECEQHLELSDNSTHFVKIDHSIYQENINVKFTNGIEINCHVIGLEYIDGVTLKEYLDSKEIVSARRIAQIAIDLITILHDLKKNAKYHNDLHTGNIMVEFLSVTKKRSDAIDENIRIVAIDLGSLTQETKSNDESNRVGDLHQIAICLNLLSRRITDNPNYYNEKDWRLAFLLEEKADYFKPSIIHQKQLSYSDIIHQIEDTVYSQTNPWQQRLTLKSFDDAVNAQSLRPWYIPSLIVDRNNNWLNRISTRGPQVITGMRGCGKTMLLRALEFHARIGNQSENEKQSIIKIEERLKNDGYLGLYVSCMKLLDFDTNNTKKNIEIFEPYSKLFIAYAIQSIYAIRHFKDIDKDFVRRDYYKGISLVLSSVLNNASELENVSSDYELEIKLKSYLNSLSDGNKLHAINIHPKIAFPQLAESIKKSSDILSDFYIYFLLDDLSTRYIKDRNILSLIGELLFQDENCAFKFTTEAQTLEMVINAPGNKSQAKIGRDYTVFDLGEEVNKFVSSNSDDGKRFIEEILLKRSKFYDQHPANLTPSDILGDVTLISIAKEIVKKSKASEKKGIYHGLSALTAICVGDLGDVITLYEQIIRNYTIGAAYPVEKEKQNQCFLELCNSRLYDLNRRDTRWLDFVESFADASHHLLLQSALKNSKDGKTRLRQYTSIFIDITYGDKKRQYDQIRELIDAGIFNFQGGPAASRTNRQGFKPQQQFKLVFRKLYGVSKHIGISSADRFELSGKLLAEWLENPKNGKEILINNLNPMSDEILDNLLEKKYQSNFSDSYQQLGLFTNVIQESNEAEKEKLDYTFILDKLPKIEIISTNDVLKIKFNTIVIGLGFEEATLKSAKEIAKIDSLEIVFISYDEKGKSLEIINEFTKYSDRKITIIPFKEYINIDLEFHGNVLCDITGLPQSIIFEIIQKSMSIDGELFFSITDPQLIYPIDDEIQPILDQTIKKDKSELLNEVSKLVKGESSEYTIINLLPPYINISDPIVLFSFASAKHERLYKLLDGRDFEKINIVVPKGTSPREELAKIAANFALRKYNNATIHEINENDINSTLIELAKDYYTYFIVNNFPFEIALTGSKYQTAAAAIFCSLFRISQVWYVQPLKWKKNRFSSGALDTKIYKVTHAK